MMQSHILPTPSQPKPRIAALDDEEDILELLRSTLGPAGFQLATYARPADFLASLSREVPSALLLDLMMPGMGGFDVCKKLRIDPRTELLPVIMLTARADEIDKVLAFELGVDDYVTKPFSPRELVSRVKAVLRRTENLGAKKAETLRLGDLLVLDLSRVKCWVKGVEVVLTTTEFRLLAALVEHKEMVLARDRILEKLWNNEKFVTARTIDVHIKHLRTKLGEAGAAIKNIRGMGYKIEP